MIQDTLRNFDAYVALHPSFKAVADFLKANDLSKLEKGAHQILPDGKLFVNISDLTAKPCAEAKLECHRKYIDIQVPISATEIMGWLPVDELPAGTEVHEDGDYALAQCPVGTWSTVRPGEFIIFFPGDAHAPGCGEGPIHKAIFKVMV